MRRSWILVISLASASVAEARPSRSNLAPPAPPPDFWSEIVEPHAAEVRRLVENARTALKITDDATQMDAEWAVDQRMRYFQDAYSLMRYARRLSPENADVLAILGRAADELGKTRQALEALEAYVTLKGPDKAGPEVLGRLGLIYLRLGQRDDAIRWLALARGSLRAETAQPMIHLANALAARGEVTAAIDTLVNALPAASAAYYTQELTLASFALAVIYDRDEQRSAAFDVLERMRSTLQQQFGPQVLNTLAAMRFAPAEDQHYYLALLYEVLDQYVEARAEWAQYAASGDSPWRARALEHVREIDARPLPKPVRVTPAATTTSPPPPRRYRPPTP